MPVRHATPPKSVLSAGNRMAIGCHLQRSYPIDDSPAFEELLKALRTAGRSGPAPSLSETTQMSELVD